VEGKGLDAVYSRLAETFDREPVMKSYQRYATEISRRELRMGATGLLTASSSTGRRVPSTPSTAMVTSRAVKLAASYQAIRDAYRARETELDTATRDQQATEREKSRRLRLAEVADAELRHRHPRQPWPALPAAEPQPAPGRGPDHDGEREIPIDSGHSRGHDYDSQPLVPAASLAETSRQLEEAAKPHRDLAARLTDRHRLSTPAYDISPAFPLTTAQRGTAILRPPKPEIPPSSWVLERVAGRDLDPEAAD
jgi:hypothetical protein